MALAMVLLSGSLVQGALITVGKPSDPSTLSSVQEALAKSRPGDTLRVYPGTYQGNIEIKTDNILIEGIGLPRYPG